MKPLYSADIYTTGVVPIGGQTSASIGFAGDMDWFKVSLIKNYTYQFDAIENSNLDLDMFLRDKDGSYIDYDDDSGLDNNPRLTFTANLSNFFNQIT